MAERKNWEEKYDLYKEILTNNSDEKIRSGLTLQNYMDEFQTRDAELARNLSAIKDTTSEEYRKTIAQRKSEKAENSRKTKDIKDLSEKLIAIKRNLPLVEKQIENRDTYQAILDELLSNQKQNSVLMGKREELSKEAERLDKELKELKETEEHCNIAINNPNATPEQRENATRVLQDCKQKINENQIKFSENQINLQKELETPLIEVSEEDITDCKNKIERSNLICEMLLDGESMKDIQKALQQPKGQEQQAQQSDQQQSEELVEEQIEKTAGEQPVVKQPVIEEPTIEELIEEQLMSESFAVKVPVEEQPMAEQPAVEDPVEEQPMAEQPVLEEQENSSNQWFFRAGSLDDQPAVEEPVEEQPVAEEPAVEEPVEKQPTFEEQEDFFSKWFNNIGQQRYQEQSSTEQGTNYENGEQEESKIAKIVIDIDRLGWNLRVDRQDSKEESGIKHYEQQDKTLLTDEYELEALEDMDAETIDRVSAIGDKYVINGIALAAYEGRLSPKEAKEALEEYEDILTGKKSYKDSSFDICYDVTNLKKSGIDKEEIKDLKEYAKAARDFGAFVIADRRTKLAWKMQDNLIKLKGKVGKLFKKTTKLLTSIKPEKLKQGKRKIANKIANIKSNKIFTKSKGKYASRGKGKERRTFEEQLRKGAPTLEEQAKKAEERQNADINETHNKEHDSIEK